MLKPWLTLMLSVMLILTLRSQASSGADLAPAKPLSPDPFACLSREGKERIAECAEENFNCHTALAKSDKVVRTDWESLSIAFFVGVIASTVVANQLRH